MAFWINQINNTFLHKTASRVKEEDTYDGEAEINNNICQILDMQGLLI